MNRLGITIRYGAQGRTVSIPAEGRTFDREAITRAQDHTLRRTVVGLAEKAGVVRERTRRTRG